MLREIKTNADNPQQLDDHIDFVYTGSGYVLKPVYRDYTDNSGSYLLRFDLYYYGVKVTFFDIPEGMEGKKRESYHHVAHIINSQLRRGEYANG
ncbi:MAG: hypothetical protein VW683_10080 [Betaproteobacteria bacterium]